MEFTVEIMIWLIHVYYTTKKNNKENQCTDTTLVNKYIEYRIP